MAMFFLGLVVGAVVGGPALVVGALWAYGSYARAGR